MAYDSNQDIVHVPCLNYSDSTYWVDFKVRQEVSFIIELIDFCTEL